MSKKSKVPPLWYSRRQTAKAFNRSVSWVIRAEHLGWLKPVRPSNNPNAKVAHLVEQVEALARGEEVGDA